MKRQCMPVLIAEKHSTEYLIHKYWARKPANVVGALISRYTEEGDLVLDPFCGSGVSLIEAARLGRPAIGIDLSPIAALLSRVATRSVDREAVREAWQSLLQSWLPLCARRFMWRMGGRRVTASTPRWFNARNATSRCGPIAVGSGKAAIAARYAIAWSPRRRETAAAPPSSRCTSRPAKR